MMMSLLNSLKTRQKHIENAILNWITVMHCIIPEFQLCAAINWVIKPHIGSGANSTSTLSTILNTTFLTSKPQLANISGKKCKLPCIIIRRQTIKCHFINLLINRSANLKSDSAKRLRNYFSNVAFACSQLVYTPNYLKAF